MLKRNISVCSVILIAFCLALTFFSCGKKGNPVPIPVAKAGMINDLKGEVRDGVLFLSFTPATSLGRKETKTGEEEPKIASFRVVKGCGTCLGDLQPLRTIVLSDKRGYTLAGNRLYFYDDDLMPGESYAYRVYPVTERGTTGEASNPFVIKWKEPPGPPEGPLKIVTGDARVELSWTKEEDHLYNVYRYDNGKYPVVPVNPRPISTALYMDAGLTNGRTYTYEVRRVVPGPVPLEGEGLKGTATPRDKTPPGAPMGVKAERKGKAIALAWQANVEKDLGGYNVYRIMGSQAVKINSTPLKETGFLDTGAPDFRFIAYHVTAVDTEGNESEPSQESIIQKE
ncbi:MAG: Exoglucanase B precursor [Syntrophorhabdus sp. PtaB.Bin047]|nr:MAG: Exoglucanase B precursor [Syntrophorhabdus sp. PtaB.Bin047]